MPVLTENWRMRPKHSWYSKLMRKYYNIRVNLTKPHNPVPDSDILQKAEKEKRLVIQVPFGGLGDHLAYSSLPELLWEQKGIKTFLSDRSVFRSKATRNFIWELNPYVEFTSLKGWFVYKPLQNDFPTLDGYLQNLFKLEGDGCPKVYYNPSTIEQLQGKAIVDPSFGPAGKANGYYEPDFHKRFIGYLQTNVGKFVLITHRHEHVRTQLEDRIRRVFDPDCYTVSAVEELANVLSSAGKRLLLYSGGASLSAAMGLTSIVLCNRRAAPNFQYSINNYVDLM